MYDPDEVAPNGLTYGQIDAREADSVRRCNEALAALPSSGAKWWGYSVSHQTFDLIVGDPLARGGNVAICCPGAVSIAGPISWTNQRLQMDWVCNRQGSPTWTYTIFDESAGFRLKSHMLLWRQNFDVLANGSIWFSARAPLQDHLEYICPACRFASYGHHPYCAQCGHKLPSAAKMFGMGLTRPVSDPLNIMQMGYRVLQAEVEKYPDADV